MPTQQKRFIVKGLWPQPFGKPIWITHSSHETYAEAAASRKDVMTWGEWQCSSENKNNRYKCQGIMIAFLRRLCRASAARRFSFHREAHVSPESWQ